ncbi:hypothetical protein HU200_003452 [Digitaria exilis]|uniref:Uncharacterized protein n=1 Tax=Digitaria exilis TaxID=1010633 RepID=A0A835FVK2_9POAL|nr:hypothetical protein HU200_003452 [Digitaria exilis]
MQPPPKKLARVDTHELKAQIVKRLGRQRAELYFRSLSRFLGCQLDKGDFEKICVAAFGKENIKLHNLLVRAILGNACLSDGPPPSKQAPTGNSQTSTVSNGTLTNGLLTARRVRPLGKRFGDKPSPIGKSPLGHLGAGEFVSAGSKALQEVISVEDGEEVDQTRGSPVCVQSQSPIRAPLGVQKAQNSQPSTSCSSDVCYNNGELPDSQSLSKLLEDKLKAQGLSMRLPKECADVLNSGLNVYMSRMLKAALGVAKARGNSLRMRQANGRNAAAPAAVYTGQNNGFRSESICSYQASLLDLWTAVQSNGLGSAPMANVLLLDDMDLFTFLCHGSAGGSKGSEFAAFDVLLVRCVLQYNSGVLPYSQLLSKLLEDKLKAQGLSLRLPKVCADVLNSGLNVYMSQMLKACLGVAKARGNNLRMRQANGHTAAAVYTGQNNGFPQNRSVLTKLRCLIFGQLCNLTVS